MHDIDLNQEGPGAPDLVAKLREAASDDEEDLLLIENTSQEMDGDDHLASLQLSCMHCPKAEPVTISELISIITNALTPFSFPASALCSYSDVMWYRIHGQKSHDFEAHVHTSENNPGIVPEVWIRQDGCHPWGSGRCWKHAKLSHKIDRMNIIVDGVNVNYIPNMRGTSNYMVVALNENGVEIPFPLGMYPASL